MAQAKIIVFDLDGTLLNTILDIQNSVNAILEKHHFQTYTEEDYKRFVGSGMGVLVKRAFPQDSTEEQLKMYLDEMQELYRKSEHQFTKPYDGIVEMLEKLQASGVDMAVLSNKPNQFVPPTLKQFFPNISFVQALGARENTPKKPAPDGLLEILDNMNYTINECLYVGDSCIDMETAKAANVKAVGVSWGFRSTKELIESGADEIINKPIELLDITVG